MDFPLHTARHAVIGIARSRSCVRSIDHPAPRLSAHGAPPEASRCASLAPASAPAAGADAMRPSRDERRLHRMASTPVDGGETSVTFLWHTRCTLTLTRSFRGSCCRASGARASWRRRVRPFGRCKGCTLRLRAAEPGGRPWTGIRAHRSASLPNPGEALMFPFRVRKPRSSPRRARHAHARRPVPVHGGPAIRVDLHAPAPLRPGAGACIAPGADTATGS